MLTVMSSPSIGSGLLGDVCHVRDRHRRANANSGERPPSSLDTHAGLRERLLASGRRRPEHTRSRASMHSSFTVVTLVAEPIRESVDVATAEGLTSLSSSMRRAPRATVLSPVSVHHAKDLTTLYAHFNYPSRCCLVVDVSLARALIRQEAARGVIQTLLGVVAGWDCAVLILSGADAAALETLWSSPTARRCTPIGRDAASVEMLQLSLQRAWHQTAHLPHEQLNALPTEIARALTRVPAAVRAILWQALRAPDDWTVDRLAATFAITRRSFEGQCRRWGLPSPSKMLQVASRPGSSL